MHVVHVLRDIRTSCSSSGSSSGAGAAIRAAEINNCPKIAPNFGSDSRRGKGRIIALCNPCHNTEAGPKDKQNWMIICFRGPKVASRCNSSSGNITILYRMYLHREAMDGQARCSSPYHDTEFSARRRPGRSWR